MNKLSKSREIIKNSLLRLDTSVFSTRQCMGCVVAPILFGKGNRALLMDEERKRAIVFAPNQEEADFSILLLTDFIALVRDIKRQALVLDVDCKKTDLELFYSISQNELVDESVPGKYRTTNGCVLEDSTVLQLTDDEIILPGFPLPSQLYSPLREVMLPVSFPTPDYCDYLNHGFNTIEEYRTKKALRASWVAIIVAILIGVLSPIGTILLGNHCGHTTLNAEQYHEIIQLMRGND